MPKGDNPNSRKNLRPLTVEEQRKGGRKSAEVRRELKTFQQIDSETTTDEERERMLNALKKRALAGNIKAWEIYAQYMGMKPSEKVEQLNTNVIIDFGEKDGD